MSSIGFAEKKVGQGKPGQMDYEEEWIREALQKIVQWTVSNGKSMWKLEGGVGRKFMCVNPILLTEQ